MSTALTTKELTDLERLEKIVQTGKSTFVTVGLALMEICERRLYRRDWGSFNEYCEKKWGWTRQRAAQLMNATAVVQALPSHLSTTVDTERTARAVAKVEPSKRAEVVEKAKATGKPVTAKTIEVAAKVVKSEGVVDATGYKIPKSLLGLWERGSEVNSVLNSLSRIKCLLVEAHENEDVLWCEPFLNKAIAELESVYANLATAKPYAVCAICQGFPETQKDKQCRGCKGRGFMSKFRWDRVSDKMKEMRTKA